MSFLAQRLAELTLLAVLVAYPAFVLIVNRGLNGGEHGHVLIVMGIAGLKDVNYAC